MNEKRKSRKSGGVNMIRIDPEWFDLNKIMDSGQCFRILPDRDGSIVALSGDRFVRASKTEDGAWELDCSQEDLDGFWGEYFDLGRDYSEWFGSVDPDDAYLMRAAAVGKGLRVVNQDPWETLVSFIISQRKSVPSITGCVTKLCHKFGDPIGDEEMELFSFPRPERLAGLSKTDLCGCSMGYRDEYVIDAARRVASGNLDLEALRQASDQHLLDALMQVKGVGIKVASCTALYGFHRLDLFPIDVWIKRTLDEHYPGGFPKEKYPGYSGFMQLLMFYEARH